MNLNCNSGRTTDQKRSHNPRKYTCNESKLQFWPKTHKAKGNRKQTQCPAPQPKPEEWALPTKSNKSLHAGSCWLTRKGGVPQRTPAEVTCQQTGGWRCVFGSSLQCFVLVSVFVCGLHSVFAVRAGVCQHTKIWQFNAAPNESIHMNWTETPDDG